MLKAHVAPWISQPQSDADSSLVDIADTVPGSSSKDIDTIPLASLCAVKYKLCLYNVAEDKWRSFELYAGKQTSTTVDDTLYARIGANLRFDVDFLVVATNAVLRITNNETFDLTVEGTKVT